MNGKTIATVVVLVLMTVIAVSGAIYFDYTAKEGPIKQTAPAQNSQDTPANTPAAPEDPPADTQDDEPEADASKEETEQSELEKAFEEAKGRYNLILANVDNPLPSNFEVETEVVQSVYELDTRIAETTRQMIQDAKAEGVDLLLCSGYRSTEKQTSLFDAQKEEYIEDGKSEEEAEALTASAIAYPGTSEHETGLAADIVTMEYQNLDEGFAETDAFKWLDENAWKYGFILRYPADKEDITKIMYESWHYRYVGKIHAKLIKDSGLCLEEYLEQAVPAGLTLEMLEEEEAVPVAADSDENGGAEDTASEEAEPEE